MQYLQSKFSIYPTGRTDVSCEACVFPEAARRRGIEHAPDCPRHQAALASQKRMFEALHPKLDKSGKLW